MKPSLEKAGSASIGSKGDAPFAFVEGDDVLLEEIFAAQEVKADIETTRHSKSDREAFLVQFHPESMKTDSVGPAAAGGDGNLFCFDLHEAQPPGLCHGQDADRGSGIDVGPDLAPPASCEHPDRDNGRDPASIPLVRKCECPQGLGATIPRQRISCNNRSPDYNEADVQVALSEGPGMGAHRGISQFGSHGEG